jgi:hypothetical protein
MSFPGGSSWGSSIGTMKSSSERNNSSFLPIIGAAMSALMHLNLRQVSVVSSMFALAMAVQAQQPAPQITGRVVRADNGAPIQGAIIYLSSSIGGSGEPPSAKTDSNGEYSITGVRGGDYLIGASAEGFLEGDNQPGARLADRIQRVDASTRLRVDFWLQRPALLSGIVVNQDGKPRPGLRVLLIRRERGADGSESYFPAGSPSMTDAEGHFVMKELWPDTYLVCVNCAVRIGGPMGAIIPFGDRVLTWYGDTASVEAALPVLLKEGEERSDIRISARPQVRFIR